MCSVCRTGGHMPKSATAKSGKIASKKATGAKKPSATSKAASADKPRKTAKKSQKATGADVDRAAVTAVHANAGGIAAHGSARLSSVIVDSYNLEIRDKEGFVGDRASGRAFRATLDQIRKALRQHDRDGDPLGDDPSSEISKSTLDSLLAEGDLEAAGVVLGAIEHFANELAHVARRFLRDSAWKDTRRIVVGGGLKDSRVGELAVGRAMVLLKSEGVDITMEMIRHHPDEAGLIGSAHLAPAWVYEGRDSILAVDVGGSNIRCGVVDVNLGKKNDLSKARVWKSELWRHRDEDPKRDEAVGRLTDMLLDLIGKAEKDGRKLCPLIGVGVPGVIGADGAIARGGQNLPGNWESSRFNLADSLRKAIPEIGGHETSVIMHNDAVVQGLSQTPFMQDIDHWGVMTIGTGLGNARYTNRSALEEE